MKNLTAAVLAILLLPAVIVFAVNTKLQTRVITSATLTINVKDGVYLTIENFTQDNASSGQRGVVVAGIFSTPAPAPTATPTPNPTPTPTGIALTATKTDNAVGGQVTFPNSWTWTIHVANGGNMAATFFLFDTILLDNLPSSNIAYSALSVGNFVSITNSGAISCSILGTDLTCIASTSNVTIGAGGSFDVSFTAKPITAGTYANPDPSTGGNCAVDPFNQVTMENNNTCADTVISNSPNATPTPINATALTAAILSNSPAEFVNPIIIAGPATLTIDPVPGATLTITYRKSVQPSGLPTPTPTSTSTPAPTATPTATIAALSVGSSTTSSQTVVAVASMPSDDDDTFSTPTPTATPTAMATSTPMATASITPTPTPGR